MPPKRNELSVPVHRDKRTFEQQHRDMLANIEHQHGRRGSSSLVPADPHHDWNLGLNDWIEGSWGRLNHDLDNMRRSMLWLEPFGEPLMGGGLWGGPSPFIMPSFGPLMSHMDHELEAMRREMGDMNSIADFVRNSYEVGEDGKAHFKLRINAQGFAPEDIQVKADGRELTVRAKKSITSESGSSLREFNRKVHLPASIVQDKLDCMLSEDGVLTLAAPVDPKEAQKLTIDSHNRLAIKPRPAHEVTLKKTGIVGLVVQGDRIHVEVPVGPGWKPEELSIRVVGKRLQVTGRKPDQPPGSSVFSMTYSLPEVVDMMSLTSQLIDDWFVIEAPLTGQQ